MSDSVSFQAQLASIMEVLAKAAVAEITKLVDDYSAFLRLEVSRSQKENHGLWRKLKAIQTEHGRGVRKRTVCNGEKAHNPGKVFEKQGYSHRAHIELTAVEVATTSQPTIVENEYRDPEEDRPEVLIIKEEAVEEDLWNRDSDGGLHIRGEGTKQSCNPLDGRDEAPFELLHCGEKGAQCMDTESTDEFGSRNIRDDLSGLQTVLKMETVSEKGICQTGSEVIARRLNQSFEYGTCEEASQGYSHVAGEHLGFFCAEDQPAMAVESPLVRSGHQHYGTSGGQMSLSERSTELNTDLDYRRTGKAQASTELNTDLDYRRTGKAQASTELNTDLDYRRTGKAQASTELNTDLDYRRTGKAQASTELNTDLDYRRTGKAQASTELNTDLDYRRTGKAQASTELNTDLDYRRTEKAQASTELNTDLDYRRTGKAQASTELNTDLDYRRTGKGKKKISCMYCGKSYPYLSYLKRHLRNHTGERPFCCTQCGKGFTRQSVLNRHKKIHTGEKPFNCFQCGRSFARLSHLNRHLQTHLEANQFP